MRQTSSYSLSSNPPRDCDGAYSEYLHLEFEGRCIAPAKHAGRTVKLAILGNRQLLEPSRDPDWRPLGIGYLTIRGERADYLGSIPYDAAWGVAASVASGAFKYLSLTGEPLKRGGAQIGYMRFCANYDSDDFC